MKVYVSVSTPLKTIFLMRSMTRENDPVSSTDLPSETAVGEVEFEESLFPEI